MGEIPTVEELSSQLLEREIELNEKQVTAEERRGGEGRGGSYMVILHLDYYRETLCLYLFLLLYSRSRSSSSYLHPYYATLIVKAL